jgi:glycosyltransferase involved in cell wall biosynthesis
VKVAFVHDWLVSWRGGEKVLDALISLYPDAPVYTLFYDQAAMPASITSRKVIRPQLMQPVRRLRKLALPVLPNIIESFDFSGYDLVISTSSCVAKGIRTQGKTKHLCYLHSPMRYIWDQQEEYIEGVAHIPGAAWAIRAMTPRLRRWDVSSAQRVDRFVVNSTFVGERCRDFYNRGSVVIHPPIETDRFRPAAKPTAPGERYLLAAGALVSYKRFDLAVQAARLLGRKLTIAGSGPMESQLRKMAGPEVTFEIGPSDARFTELLTRADALLFPGVEDFGMVAVEAMAAGTPVIAFARGGARDFIEEGRTGMFFHEGSADSLADAVRRFDKSSFDTGTLNAYAQGYCGQNFLEKIKKEISLVLQGERT